jgi:hypothetical protein
VPSIGAIFGTDGIPYAPARKNVVNSLRMSARCLRHGLSKESHKIEGRQEIVTLGQPCCKVSSYLLIASRARGEAVGKHAMQKLDPQLVQIMRNALEEVMTRVPLEYSTSSTKAYLAECILKAAAQGQTGYDQLVAAAADQIDQIPAVLSPFI